MTHLEYLEEHHQITATGIGLAHTNLKHGNAQKALEIIEMAIDQLGHVKELRNSTRRRNAE